MPQSLAPSAVHFPAPDGAQYCPPLSTRGGAGEKRRGGSTSPPRHTEFTTAAQHLAFGTGLQCVGAAFARAEIETVAALLLPLLEDVRYRPGFEYRETGLYTRGPVALPLEFAPGARNPRRQLISVSDAGPLHRPPSLVRIFTGSMQWRAPGHRRAKPSWHP
jgi:hypothetical protein